MPYSRCALCPLTMSRLPLVRDAPPRVSAMVDGSPVSVQVAAGPQGLDLIVLYLAGRGPEWP